MINKMSALERKIIDKAVMLLQLINSKITEENLAEFIKTPEGQKIIEVKAEMPQWVTPLEARKILNCSKPTVYSMINNGDLRYRNLGGKKRGQLRVMLSDVIKSESLEDYKKNKS